jgi:hypothetical protein
MKKLWFRAGALVLIVASTAHAQYGMNRFQEHMQSVKEWEATKRWIYAGLLVALGYAVWAVLYSKSSGIGRRNLEKGLSGSPETQKMFRRNRIFHQFCQQKNLSSESVSFAEFMPHADEYIAWMKQRLRTFPLILFPLLPGVLYLIMGMISRR